MPIVVPHEPVSAMIALANQAAQQRQLDDRERQVQAINAEAQQRQTQAEQYQAGLQERQREFDIEQGNHNQAVAQQQQQTDAASVAAQNPDMGTGGLSYTQKLQLRTLTAAHAAGTVNDDQFIKGQLDILGGSHDPLGHGAGDPYEALRFELSKNRNEANQQSMAYHIDRATALDQVNAASKAFEAVSKVRGPSSAEYQQAQRAMSDSYMKLNQVMAKYAPQNDAGAAGAGTINPSNTAQPAGAAPAAPTAGGATPALKPTPRSVIRAAVAQAHGDPTAATQLLQQQGYDPNQVIDGQ